MATVNRLSNTGIMYTSGEIDEFTNNLAAQGSILFNGSSQYLSLPNINFSTNTFTIEGWFYPTTLANLTNFWGTDNGSDSTPKMIMYINSSSQLTVDMGNAGTTQFPIAVSSFSTYGLVINAWSHIALVRNDLTATGLKLYINGQLAGTGQLGTNLNTITAIFNIGYIGEAYGQKFSGYISNFRIVNGTAVYTGAFTPPTQPLQKTQLAGTNIAAITNGNTSLLLSTLYNNAFKDFSDNNFTITATANPTSIQLHPLNFDGYYSYLFNGTTQYLTAPTNAAFGFGTGDFTIEFWAYFNSISGNQQLIDTRPTSVASTVNYLALTSVSGTINYYTAGNNPSIGGSIVVLAEKWYHIAVTKLSGSTKLFINGVQSGSTYSDTTTYASGTNRPIIGVDGNNPVASFFNGYLSNFHIVKGTAVYTAAFTPPTVPLTAITNTVLLTLQSNRIKDNSTTNATITSAVATTISSNTLPFSTLYANTGLPVSKQYSNGTLQIVGSLDEVSLNSALSGSILFNGTTQYLATPSTSALNFGTGDYTVEGWFYWTSVPGNARPFIDGQTTGSFQFYWDGGTYLANRLTISNRSTNQLRATLIPAAHTWYHIAAVRNAGTVSLYVNGVSVGSAADSTNYATTAIYNIGGDVGNAGTWYFPGYISNLRVVKGVAVYTGAFTPPTQPLQKTQLAGTNIAAITNDYTSLLLSRYRTSYEDESNYKNIITPVASPTLSYETPLVTAPDGYYSAAFTTASTYLTVPYNSNWAIPAGGAFCIEAWVYLNAMTFGQQIVGLNQNYGSAPSSWGLLIDGNGTNAIPQLGIADAGGPGQGGTFYLLARYSAGVYNFTAIKTWVHLAITRDSTGAVRSFINGLMNAYYFTALTTGSGRAFAAASGNLYIGESNNLAAPFFNGVISNLRFVNGEVPAAYATSSTILGSQIFTPSQTPLTNIANTKLLICQSNTFIDNGTANAGATGYTITNNGGVIISRIKPFIYPSTTPTITANTTLRKQFSNGAIQIINKFDEYTSIA
jgi:hypothetical protein